MVNERKREGLPHSATFEGLDGRANDDAQSGIHISPFLLYESLFLLGLLPSSQSPSLRLILQLVHPSHSPPWSTGTLQLRFSRTRVRLSPLPASRAHLSTKCHPLSFTPSITYVQLRHLILITDAYLYHTEAFEKVIYTLFGLYVWEMFQTVHVEWSLLTRARKFRWPMVRRPLA